MCHGSVTLTITVLLRFSSFSQLKVLYFLLADLKTVPEMFGMIVSVLFFNNFQFGFFFGGFMLGRWFAEFLILLFWKSCLFPNSF